MNNHPLFCILFIFTLCATSGCSRSSSSPAEPISPATDSTAKSTPRNDGPSVGEKAAAPIACNKLFSPGDVAGIFPGAVAVSTDTQRDNACLFKSADTSMVQVSGDDDTEQSLWSDPELNQRDKYYKRMVGFGDEAFFKASDGAQAYVKKGDHYCGVVAGVNEPKVTGEALARQLATLCDKYFSAR